MTATLPPPVKTQPTCQATPSADLSAEILTDKLRVQQPFTFVRFGDADIPWMLGRGEVEQTCDGEKNRDGLGRDLQIAWDRLVSFPNYLCGDLCTMSSPAEDWVQDEFRRLCSEAPRPLTMLHTEALLIHRLSPRLRGFYEAVRRDQRTKVLVGPWRIKMAADLLRAQFVPIHSTHAHEPGEIKATLTKIKPFFNWGVLLIAGGRASKILAAHMVKHFPTRTVVELGSALDPLFVGQTRGEQIPMEEARAYFSGLWWME
jgi:hypothetical protein